MLQVECRLARHKWLFQGRLLMSLAIRSWSLEQVAWIAKPGRYPTWTLPLWPRNQHAEDPRN